MDKIVNWVFLVILTNIIRWVDDETIIFDFGTRF